MIRILLLGAGAILLAGAAPADNASSDAIALGARIARHGTSTGALPCMACHGSQFEGNPAIGAPRLAGLPVATTLAALDAIGSGRIGQNYVMRNIANALTGQERAAVAAYFASLKPGP